MHPPSTHCSPGHGDASFVPSAGLDAKQPAGSAAGRTIPSWPTAAVSGAGVLYLPGRSQVGPSLVIAGCHYRARSPGRGPAYPSPLRAALQSSYPLCGLTPQPSAAPHGWRCPGPPARCLSIPEYPMNSPTPCLPSAGSRPLRYLLWIFIPCFGCRPGRRPLRNSRDTRLNY